MPGKLGDRRDFALYNDGCAFGVWTGGAGAVDVGDELVGVLASITHVMSAR